MTENPEADMGTCAEALAAMQTLLDGELDGARAVRILGHLEACAPCGLEADFYRRLKHAVAGCENDVDPAVLTRLRQFADQVVDTGSASPA